MVGADKTTELWWPPSCITIVVLFQAKADQSQKWMIGSEGEGPNEDFFARNLNLSNFGSFG